MLSLRGSQTTPNNAHTTIHNTIPLIMLMNENELAAPATFQIVLPIEEKCLQSKQTNMYIHIHNVTENMYHGMYDDVK